MIVHNPMNFSSCHDHLTPEYIIDEDFRRWLAYGLMCCWLGDDPNDPNSGCDMPRPITIEDVKELRGYFLDLVQTVIVSIWQKRYSPGDGCIEGDWQYLSIEGEESAHICWYVSFHDESIVFELNRNEIDSTEIFLSYEAIQDYNHVLEVLKEAYQQLAVDEEIWEELVKLVEHH